MSNTSVIFRLIYAISRPIYDTRFLIVIIFLWKMFVVQLHIQIYMCMMLRQLKCLCGMRDDVFNFN